jgi:hypothetical protein
MTKVQWVKVKKVELEQLKSISATSRKDYNNLYDKHEILKAKVEVAEVLTTGKEAALYNEIRDLKLILAGMVCKDNPFINKRDADIHIQHEIGHRPLKLITD